MKKREIAADLRKRYGLSEKTLYNVDNCETVRSIAATVLPTAIYTKWLEEERKNKIDFTGGKK